MVRDLTIKRIHIIAPKAAYLRIIRKDLIAWLMLIPSLILFVFFSWQPLISGILLSFFKTKGFDAIGGVNLQNYIDVMSDPNFMSALLNSFKYIFWSLVLGFIFPIIAAIIMNEVVHFKAFFRFSLFFPEIVPMVATALLWYFIFDPGQGGLLNTILNSFGLSSLQWLQDPSLTVPLIVITIVWRSLGSNALIYLASLQGINQELYEVASLDGAGIIRKIWSITLPQISGIVGIMFVLTVIGSFQIFYEPLAMTDGGPVNASITLSLQTYNYAFKYFEAGKSMASGTITMLILMVLTALYFKIKKNSDSE